MTAGIAYRTATDRNSGKALTENGFIIDLIVNLDILLTWLLFPKYPYT